MQKIEFSDAMIVMLDTAQNLETCAGELGCEVEQLFTPLTARKAQDENGMFAIDNGAFSKFNAHEFQLLLNRHKHRISLCRFVAVPDVVGSAIRTIECFNFWSEQLSGWPIAFVCQDGQENYEIPWSKCAAIFIGGSTDWKMSKHAEAIIKASKVIGKWCHVGRVNTPGRFEYFQNIGADSCDGTGLARYSHMRKAIYENSITERLL